MRCETRPTKLVLCTVKSCMCTYSVHALCYAPLPPNERNAFFMDNVAAASNAAAAEIVPGLHDH